MQGYLNQAQHLQSSFELFTIQQILRSRNTHVDSLATLATSSGQDLPRVILVEDLHKPIEEKREKVQVHHIMVEPSWMNPLVMYLKEDTLPYEKGEVDKIRRKAPCFWLFEEQKLYKHSFSRPYLLCIHPEAVKPLLEELHKGIYGSHRGGKSLPYLGVLVAKYAKRSTRICKEV